MMTFQRWLGLFVLTLACGSLASCASSGRGHGGQKVLISLHDYRSGQALELANETHTDRVEYYSHDRGGAARKVQTDEVIAALVDELDDHGFESHAQSGPVPASARSEVVRWGIEVELNGQPTHWLIGPGSQKAEWEAFQQCRELFVQLYNVTVSYQTVRNAAGSQFFQDEVPVKTR